MSVRTTVSLLEGLPFVEDVVYLLEQVMESRIEGCMNITSGVQLRKVVIDEFVNSLDESSKRFVDEVKDVFYSWLYDKVEERYESRGSRRIRMEVENEVVECGAGNEEGGSNGRRMVNTEEEAIRNQKRSKTGTSINVEKEEHKGIRGNAAVPVDSVPASFSSDASTEKTEGCSENYCTQITINLIPPHAEAHVVNSLASVGGVDISGNEKIVADKEVKIAAATNTTNYNTEVVSEATEGAKLKRQKLHEKRKEKNKILYEKQFTIDNTTTLTEKEIFNEHVKWYKENIAIKDWEINMSIGYYEVQYPEELLRNYESSVDRMSVITTSPEEKRDMENMTGDDVCCLCDKRIHDGDRITMFWSEPEDDVQEDPNHNHVYSCEHKCCEVCSYRFYVNMPLPSQHQTTYLFKKVNKRCKECNFSGDLRKKIFNKDLPLNYEFPGDWLVDDVFPDNEYIFAIHQIPNYACCNFITSSTLANAIEAIEQPDQLGLPIRKQKVPGMTEKHYKKYDNYRTAVFEEFTCTMCGSTVKSVYGFKGSMCNTQCDTKICYNCCVTQLIKCWGKKRGKDAIDNYTRGVLVCSCKKQGRMVNCVTDQYVTKYVGEFDIIK